MEPTINISIDITKPEYDVLIQALSFYGKSTREEVKNIADEIRSGNLVDSSISMDDVKAYDKQVESLGSLWSKIESEIAKYQ